MNVLVTGAGSGIGEATARLLTVRDFRVAVTDLDEHAAERVATELGSFATALDVTSRESVRDAMDKAEAAMGPLDSLVANAGVSSFVSFLDMPDADWHLMLDVNTTGIFHCGQEFARRLVAANRQGLDRQRGFHGGQAGTHSVVVPLCGFEVRSCRAHPVHGL